MDQVLPYKILEDCIYEAEEEDIVVYQDLVLATAEGRLDITTAASQITESIYDDALRAKQDIDSNNKDQTYPLHINLLAQVIGSAASSYPPSHPAHDRLIGLLDAFTAVQPKREVPNPLVDREGNLHDTYAGQEDVLNTRPTIVLWESIKQLELGANLELLADHPRGHWSGIEKVESVEQKRWRNLNYFLARLTTEGKADLTWVSALFMLLPKHRIPHPVPGWTGYLAGQVLAAAQWIIPEGHGAWVWRQCRDDARNGRDWYWNLEVWNVCAKAFEELVNLPEEKRISALARQEAGEALKVMRGLDISLAIPS